MAYKNPDHLQFIIVIIDLFVSLSVCLSVSLSLSISLLHPSQLVIALGKSTRRHSVST